MKNTNLLWGVVIGAAVVYVLSRYNLLPLPLKNKLCPCTNKKTAGVEQKQSERQAYCEKAADAKMAALTFVSAEGAKKFREKTIAECMAAKDMTATITPVPLSNN